MSVRRCFRLVRTCFLLVGLPLVLSAVTAEAAPARLTFIKTFPGSVPDYVHVSVDETGAANYRASPDPSSEPQAFRLSPEFTARLFGLVAALNYFQGIELESPHKVAYMGTKTFTYEKDGQQATVSYNYTVNATADELQIWLERIGRGRYYIQQLEFRLQYDRLGILEVLREFERDFNAGELVDVQQFASLLERIANDRGLPRLAQIRARELLRRIQGGPARLQIEYGDKRNGWYYGLIADQPDSILYDSRRIGDPPDPRPKALPNAATRRLWELVQLANYFREAGPQPDPADPMSVYRLTYEAGMEKNSLAFTSPPTAALAEMVHIFQQVLQQEYFLNRLREASADESPTLLLVLQEVEVAVQKDALIEPGEFVSLLEAVANGEKYDALTRQQAGRVLARVRASSRQASPP